MIKNGEIYESGPLEKDAMGFLINQPSRSRNICKPCNLGCGVMTTI